MGDASEKWIGVVKVVSASFLQWKATWWWLGQDSVCPAEGYGDEGNLAGWAGKHSSMAQLLKILPDQKDSLRIRVKLTAPTRSYEFIGYVGNAKTWLYELRKKHAASFGGVIEMLKKVTAQKSQDWGPLHLPPLSAGWDYGEEGFTPKLFVASQNDWLGESKHPPAPLLFPSGSMMQKMATELAPWQWQAMAEGKQSLFVEHSHSIGDKSGLKPKMKTVHAKPASYGWSIYVSDEEVAKLGHEHMTLLCWGHPDPLGQAMADMPPAVAKMMFNKSKPPHEAHVDWEHPGITSHTHKWSPQKVKLTAEFDNYGLFWRVKGFGMMLTVADKMAAHMTFGV